MRSRTFHHSNLYKTPGVVPSKVYTHLCQGCKETFCDGCHNTKRCVGCRKKKKKAVKSE